MRIVLGLIVALVGLPGMAQEVVPLPRERPEVVEAEVPLPRVRPEAAAEAEAGEVYGPPAPPVEAEPEEPRIYQTACPAVLLGRVEATALPPIAEGQCGAQSPLSVTGVLANGRMVSSDIRN